MCGLGLIFRLVSPFLPPGSSRRKSGGLSAAGVDPEIYPEICVRVDDGEGDNESDDGAQEAVLTVLGTDVNVAGEVLLPSSSSLESSLSGNGLEGIDL